MKEYPYMPLSEAMKYEPEMRRLGVSKVARSPGGFLHNYRKIGGDQKLLTDYWRKKRNGFISRHMAQYKIHPTYRRWLALVAWAYRAKEYNWR